MKAVPMVVWLLAGGGARHGRIPVRDAARSET